MSPESNGNLTGRNKSRFYYSLFTVTSAAIGMHGHLLHKNCLYPHFEDQLHKDKSLIKSTISLHRPLPYNLCFPNPFPSLFQFIMGKVMLPSMPRTTEAQTPTSVGTRPVLLQPQYLKRPNNPQTCDFPSSLVSTSYHQR